MSERIVYWPAKSDYLAEVYCGTVIRETPKLFFVRGDLRTNFNTSKEVCVSKAEAHDTEEGAWWVLREWFFGLYEQSRQMTDKRKVGLDAIEKKLAGFVNAAPASDTSE